MLNIELAIIIHPYVTFLILNKIQCRLLLPKFYNFSQLTEAIIRSALAYGNVSGCICVQQKGAIASIPTRARIEEYIRSEGA